MRAVGADDGFEAVEDVAALAELLLVFVAQDAQRLVRVGNDPLGNVVEFRLAVEVQVNDASEFRPRCPGAVFDATVGKIGLRVVVADAFDAASGGLALLQIFL